MEEASPPSPPPHPPPLQTAGMEVEDPSTYTSAPWDWGDLLDFTVDDHLSYPLDPDHLRFPSLPPPPPPPPPPPAPQERVRKRDPRLTCSNFLEGRIPCSCPEIDEKMEEQGLPGKKRVRTSTRNGSGVARCQVPGCEADISELKGYHRRHRVCIRCANATSVAIDGESKRYCQQCGKFHLLSDFDEGKRSCRRKLERHNNRRRRKPVDGKCVADKEHQGACQNEDVTVDGDDRQDVVCLSDQTADKEASFEFEQRHTSNLSSVPVTQSINTGSGITFTASGETQMDGGKDETKSELSPSDCDNKSAYSSVCPTGRISFKLYDWNPAEFPRRLRHQIFQWLASMPVELEGYIRPGCTILTVFVAMPEYMWAKLLGDPVTHLHDFIIKPGTMLTGRGSITIYLNNMIFRVIRGGTSVKKVNVKLRAPRLHYVHPTCFEAGKPIEFVACGSNLLQPKFRFLVSFAGKYLAHDYSFVPLRDQNTNESARCDHQFCKIYIRHSDPNLCGPAFIEVENESGLSNFIPAIIGDEDICSEMKSIQQKFNSSVFTEGRQMDTRDSSTCACKDFELRQTAFSEFMLDIAWLLRVPVSECIQQTMKCCQIQRFNRVLDYLIQSQSTAILEKVLRNLEGLLDKMGSDSFVDCNCVVCTCDSDLRLLQKYMDLARDLFRKQQNYEYSTVLSEYAVPRSICCSSRTNIPSSLCPRNQDLEPRVNCKVANNVASTPTGRSETDPLLNKEVVMKVNLVKEWPRQTCGPIYSSTVMKSHRSVFLIATAVLCFAVCAVLYHPHKVTEFAVSIRRRLVSSF